MQHVFDWFRDQIDLARPWLILGKGPTFGLRDRYNLADYELLSLNHAVREQAVRAAHIIDLDVVRACEDVLERRAQVLIMPWYPHVENRVGTESLATLTATVPVLGRLAAERRLLWYDLSTSPERHGPGPVVRATYFSAEAAVHLLALARVRRIRTLGVDGGIAYSTDFDDLRGKTLLANGQPNFDLQFRGFARTILETGVDVLPLDLPCPPRFHLRYMSENALAVEVLKHSIRRHASLSVDVVTMPANAQDGMASDGYATLLNSRVQCFVDVRPLCLEKAAAGVSWTASSVPQAWQPTSRFVQGRTRFLEYLDDGSEPWLSRAHPQGYLWVRDLLDGIRWGKISAQFVADEIRRGHVRPSLQYQVEHNLEEPLLLPSTACALDRGFQGPTGRLVRPVRPLADALAVVEALARRAYEWARAYRLQRRRSAARQVGNG